MLEVRNLFKALNGNEILKNILRVNNSCASCNEK